MSRDGTHVYVANFGSANVSVIETDGNTVVTTINVGGGPADVVVGLDGTVYVANGDSDTVSVIDATNTVASTIFVGDAPEDMALSPDGTHLYVSNFWADTVSVISIVPGTPTPVAAVGALGRGHLVGGEHAVRQRGDARRQPPLCCEQRQRHRIGDRCRDGHGGPDSDRATRRGMWRWAATAGLHT